MSDNHYRPNWLPPEKATGAIEIVNGLFRLNCSNCGPLLQAPDDGTEERHAWVVDKWSAHDMQVHGGDGIVDLRAYIDGEVME